MTYSLVARDHSTAELGVAVQSHWFSVGGVVPHVRADGTLAKGHRQMELLRAEGVRFRNGRVDMAECRASGFSARSP